MGRGRLHATQSLLCFKAYIQHGSTAAVSSSAKAGWMVSMGKNHMHMHLHPLLRTHLQIQMNGCMMMSRSDCCALAFMSKIDLCFLLSLKQPIGSQQLDGCFVTADESAAWNQLALGVRRPMDERSTTGTPV